MYKFIIKKITDLMQVEWVIAYRLLIIFSYGN